MPAHPDTPHENFASLAHRILIGEKRCPIRTAAASMEISEDSLYNRLLKRTPFQVEEARLLLRAVPEAVLANYILELSPFIVAEKVSASSSYPEALQHQATRTVLEAADILRAVEVALSDGRIGHREKLSILREVEEAERAIASIKHLLQNS